MHTCSSHYSQYQNSTVLMYILQVTRNWYYLKADGCGLQIVLSMLKSPFELPNYSTWALSTESIGYYLKLHVCSQENEAGGGTIPYPCLLQSPVCVYLYYHTLPADWLISTSHDPCPPIAIMKRCYGIHLESLVYVCYLHCHISYFV